MSKIKIEDVEYILYREDLPHYDGYYLKGEITKHEPLDSQVVGYVKEDGMNIAICKPTHKKLYPFIYVGFGVATIAVSIMCIIAFNPKIDVEHWEPASRDDIVGTLDSGEVKVSRKFQYNQYATYDGEHVTVAVYSKGNDYALKVGELQSEFVTSETNKIPMELDMLPQEIRQAKLLVKNKDSVEEYPLVIERFNNTSTEVSVGDDSDFEAGKTEIEEVIEAITPVEGEEDTYVVDDYDFENFPVLKDYRSYTEGQEYE